MATPDTDKATGALADDARRTTGSKPGAPPSDLTEPSFSRKSKKQNIHVSPAVLDAARKDTEQVLRDLRTSPGGLSQADAEERARAAGPNEGAQERRQG